MAINCRISVWNIAKDDKQKIQLIPSFCSSQPKFQIWRRLGLCWLNRRKIKNGSHDFDSFNFPGILEAIQVRKVASMNFMKALFFRSYARKIVVDATAVLLLIPAFGNHNIKTCTKPNSVCAYKSGQNIFEIAFRNITISLDIQIWTILKCLEIIRQGPLKQINGIALNGLDIR